ncbi:hypothetical protein JC606_16190 [Vibrio sp. IB15]|uniref:hypothetical protein n=1 Tax=Vibrio sp. IB15 TaxID=2779368 RepID=UPI0018E6DE25|nr:hypothetical protein [Vibrio sp. IB15]MBJ2147902.1 hypothetical protein [Vibrio sp. IB15]
MNEWRRDKNKCEWRAKNQKQIRDTGKQVTKNTNCDSRNWYIADSNLGMLFVFLISFTRFYS